jgi:hypothetical protein
VTLNWLVHKPLMIMVMMLNKYAVLVGIMIGEGQQVFYIGL